MLFDRDQDIAGRAALEKEKKDLIAKEKAAAKKSEEKKGEPSKKPEEKKPEEKKPEEKKMEEKLKPPAGDQAAVSATGGAQ